jgi:HlyD family secretion protein
MWRMPRVRFTIGRMMVAVFVAGVALGGAVYLRPVIDQLAIERKAEAAYRKAKLATQIAEVAIKSYNQGVYLQEFATYRGQIALAESNRERAIDRLEWSRKTSKTNIADSLSVQQAEFDLEQAKMQFEVLEKYTKQKQLKTLGSNLEKALENEKARLASYQEEHARRLQMLGF